MHPEKKPIYFYIPYSVKMLYMYIMSKNGRLVKIRPLDTRSIRWGDTLIQTIIRKEET